MFINVKAALVTTLLASLTLSSPVVPSLDNEAAPFIEARSADIESRSVSYNFTTHPHKLCIGHQATDTYFGSATSGTKCIDVSGKSIKLWSVSSGCKVTANDHLECGGLIHHKVTKGCNDINFQSVRIKC